MVGVRARARAGVGRGEGDGGGEGEGEDAGEGEGEEHHLLLQQQRLLVQQPEHVDHVAVNGGFGVNGADWIAARYTTGLTVLGVGVGGERG